MSSFFYRLNYIIVKHTTHYFNKETLNVVSLFNSKFKNLLDDYISNYWVKYLFFFLFLGFFCIEGVFWFFDLFIAKFEMPFHMNKRNMIPVMYMDHLLYSIYNSDVVDFFAFFFLILSKSLKYIVLSFTGISILFFYFFFAISILLLEDFTHKNKISIFSFMIFYLIIAIFFFSLCYIESLRVLSCYYLFVGIPLCITLFFYKVNFFDLLLLGLVCIITLLFPSFAGFFLLLVVLVPTSFLLDLSKSMYSLATHQPVSIVYDIADGIFAAVIFIIIAETNYPDYTFVYFMTFLLSILYCVRFFYKH